MKEFPALVDHINSCVSAKYMIMQSMMHILLKRFNTLNKWIDHDRDFLFTYAGLRQVVDKYLVQDRSTGQVYETPQFMYMMIAFSPCSRSTPRTFTRMDYVHRYYNAISKHRINIPTPIMAGVRTPLRQFGRTCVLVDVDDTLDSIFTSDMAIGRYVAQRAGIGINAGRIRGISRIRGGEVQHTGVVPFLKKFESTVRCAHKTASEVSATVHFLIQSTKKSKTSSS